MVVDFHTHVFPPHIKEDRAKYLSLDPCFAGMYSSPKARLATVEELVASMDKEGVGISVALNLGWTRDDLCRETNDYIIQSVARYPDRLVGFGTVPLGSPGAAKEIERVARAGLKGLGELRPEGSFLNDPRVTGPLVEVVREHRLILLFHASEPVGHDYPGKGEITPGVLYPFISRYPDIPVVLAHWGGGLPFYALMPEVAQALANTYFDTAASPFLYQPRIYPQVISLVGGGKILFGSDYPLLAPSRLVKEIRSLKLPPETEGRILGGNARRLLGLKEG